MLSRTTCTAWLICVFLLTIASAAWAQPARPATCSNSTLNSNLGFVVTGIDSNGPTVIGGQITADGKGGFSGSETISDNGTIDADVPVTGTYAVRANCTGKGTIAPKAGSATHFSFTVVSAGTEVQLVITDDLTVESGSAFAQGAATCTTKGIAGIYGMQATGTLFGLGPLVFEGEVKVQQGVISGTASGSLNGQIFKGWKVDGAVKVGKTCVGKAVVSLNQEPPLHLNLVVVNGGNEIVFIATDDQNGVTGSLKRLSTAMRWARQLVRGEVQVEQHLQLR